MYRIGLVCLLLAGLAWGQGAPSASGMHTAKSSHPSAKTAVKSSQAAPGTAVITINGVCDHPAAKGKPAAECKTVVTRTEFERIVDAIQPDMSPTDKRKFAERYAAALVLADRAHERGLDRGPEFAETMKIMRIQVLAQDLVKDEKDKASHISDADVQNFYRQNQPAYEEATLDRVFIPRLKQTDAAEAAKENASGAPHASSPDSEAAMKKEADDLHARAVAGEDFAKLQADAIKAAGYDVKAPETKLSKVRRANLPPDQFHVFDLKAGAVSDVLSSQQGYFIYKMESKDTMTLAEAGPEIRTSLQNQRLQDSMTTLEHSAQPTFDENYFKAAGPGPQGAEMQPPASMRRSPQAPVENSKK